MKKMLLIVILLMLLPIAHASAATYVNASAMNIEIISETPNPARPGESF
ncbi:hypothetical protein [uncultured Methanomethylovorans sp.]|nr:hypothetical protein [uncultured Methanomethylovorans sp.]